jgi:Mn2+/Fe2+ NRAMP family transporter
MSNVTDAPSAPPVPHSFGEYLRSFEPGIVIVLTWLGAGDIVDMGTAGANYGYSLYFAVQATITLVGQMGRLLG